MYLLSGRDKTAHDKPAKIEEQSGNLGDRFIHRASFDTETSDDILTEIPAEETDKLLVEESGQNHDETDKTDVTFQVGDTTCSSQL